MPIRPSTMADVEPVAKGLRMEDIREIKAASGNDPVATLSLGVLYSEHCWTMYSGDDDHLGMLGLHPDSDRPLFGYVWLLATDRLLKHQHEFLRECRTGPYLDLLHSYYPVLHNYADERNTVHLKWLKWMGFEFNEVVPLGVEQRPFVHFIRIRK